MSNIKQQTLLRILVFLGTVTVFFCIFIAGTIPKYSTASTAEEIASADLSEKYICLDTSTAEHYPGKLYTEKDFSDKTAAAGDPNAKYETCRLVLALTPGITYGITGQTATYAQKVYVNGELLNETGAVSHNPAEFEPKTDFYTVYFTPQSDTTEIIVQHSWFNHKYGAFHKIYLAEQPVITKMNRAQTLCDGLVVGTLLAMAIFFFGMFLINTRNRGMLWFSLSNLCIAVNYLIYESKQIMTLFTNLNWYIGHKIELLSNIYTFLFVALFVFSMLKIRPKKQIVAVLASVPGALTLFYILAPSTFYSRYTVPIGAAVILYELFITVSTLKLCIKENILRQPEQWFVCLSPLFTMLVSIIEGITYFSHVFYLRAYFMILLAFGNALVLTVGYTRTERSLSEARRHELEIAQENAMLEKMNHLKSDFMRNLAHEMKTPLTVMSGYAQLTERQLQKNTVTDETSVNLETIAREAGRLSDMVTQLLDVTYHGADIKTASAFYPRELLDDTAAVCRPILLKNKNEMEIVCNSMRQITAVKESLLQVLINLCINSNKHTDNGIVTICADDVPESNLIEFSVCDTGNGIRAEDLPHIFERGYSGDGSNGLGLTICRDIIESAGGRISVLSTGREGTTICFTVPAKKEGENEYNSAC